MSREATELARWHLVPAAELRPVARMRRSDDPEFWEYYYEPFS
jgi:hypothetical protein